MRILKSLFVAPCLLALLAPAIAWAEPPPASSAAPPPPASSAAPPPASSAAPPPEPPPPATTAEPPAPTAPVEAPPPATDASWTYRYKLARDRLLSGDFTQAAELFNKLALETNDPIDKALTLNQARLAIEWATRGMVLVRQAIIGESTITAKSVNERTSDELGVLYVNAVLYGIGTGAWTSVAGNAKSQAAQILPALVFAGAAAGTVALLDSGKPLRYGVPQSIVSGLNIGLTQGLVWALWNQSQDSDSRLQDKGVATLIWSFSTVGAIAGGVIGANVGTTPGRASFVSSMSLWGALVTGFSGAALVESDSGKNRDRVGFGAAVVGVNVGLVAGLAAAGPASPSIARVRYLDLGGLAGGLLTGGLYVAAADKQSKAQAAFAVTAAGMVGGLVTAWLATSSMKPDRLEAHEAPEKQEAAFHWAPTLMPSQNGVMLGVSGGM